jgi:hypothetical protein
VFSLEICLNKKLALLLLGRPSSILSLTSPCPDVRRPRSPAPTRRDTDLHPLLPAGHGCRPSARRQPLAPPTTSSSTWHDCARPPPSPSVSWMHLDPAPIFPLYFGAKAVACPLPDFLPPRRSGHPGAPYPFPSLLRGQVSLLGVGFLRPSPEITKKQLPPPLVGELRCSPSPSQNGPYLILLLLSLVPRNPSA